MRNRMALILSGLVVFSIPTIVTVLWFGGYFPKSPEQLAMESQKQAELERLNKMFEGCTWTYMKGDAEYGTLEGMACIKDGCKWAWNVQSNNLTCVERID